MEQTANSLLAALQLLKSVMAAVKVDSQARIAQGLEGNTSTPGQFVIERAFADAN